MVRATYSLTEHLNERKLLILQKYFHLFLQEHHILSLIILFDLTE